MHGRHSVAKYYLIDHFGRQSIMMRMGNKLFLENPLIVQHVCLYVHLLVVYQFD